jgi:hypothetical protein
MVAFYLNAAAQTFSSQHRKPGVTALKPWARARSAAIKATTAGATVAGGAALNTTVGQVSATGGKAPYTYSMNNSDGGNFSIDSAGVIKTAKAPPMSAPNPGIHNIVVAIQDAAANLATQSIAITVT